MDKNKRIEEILTKPYYVVDVFPYRVPKEQLKIFSEAEDYFLNGEENANLANKFTRIILKAICYYSYEVYQEKWLGTVDVCTLSKMIKEVVSSKRGFINILLYEEDVLIQVDGGVLNLTVFNASHPVQMMMQALARSEGLFWWEEEILN